MASPASPPPFAQPPSSPPHPPSPPPPPPNLLHTPSAPPTPPPSTISGLRHLVLSHPVIDNHAHNLLRRSHSAAYPFESLTSEASPGPALDHAPHTLAHLRAVKQLARWMGCDPDWSSIKTKRATLDHLEWTRTCFAGTQCLLMDDGLDDDAVEDYSWHDRFTPDRTRRIVRIEKVAETVLQGYRDELPEDTDLAELFNKWSAEFAAVMRAALNDPNVAGFKSVVCYRTGLDVVLQEPMGVPLLEAFVAILRGVRNNHKYKIKEKVFNDFLVRETARFIGEYPEKKPLQFHTGLGDNDLNLLKSNPAHLQPFIKANPDVPIVLLHSSYPYTREAGYLASVYDNVYLDFGEVFPMLSQDGQKSVIKQILELTPTNKLLWSTDGHWFPETYALANAQMREVLSEVLVKRVTKGLMTLDQAVSLTKKLLFDNSNKLYNLNLVPALPDGLTVPLSADPTAYSHPELHLLNRFLSKNPGVKFFRLQWLDYTSTLRLRLVTVKQMKKLVEKKSYLTVTAAIFCLLQNDMTTDDSTPSGQYLLVPDWVSLRSCEGYAPGHASVMCSLRDEGEEGEEGEVGGKELSTCPRTILSRAVKKAKEDHDAKFLVGFETEVVFLHRVRQGETDGFEPISNVHAWSTSRALLNKSMKILSECVEALEASGIEVLLFHPESAYGQYEIVTGPLSPLESVDALYHTRETIANIALKYDVRATFHPKPFDNCAGTAAHTHLSISPPTPENEERFFSGILDNLRAVCALTLPNVASYDRLRDGCWAGGTWVAWGEQNREVPLRRCSKKDAHWELKCVDGTSNLYFGLAGVIAAGCLGLTAKTKLPGTGCSNDPSKLTSRERNGLGITKRLPKNLEEALEALKEHKKLREWIGDDAMTKYLITKKGEKAVMEGVPEGDRKNWLLERY